MKGHKNTNDKLLTYQEVNEKPRKTYKKSQLLCFSKLRKQNQDLREDKKKETVCDIK